MEKQKKQQIIRLLETADEQSLAFVLAFLQARSKKEP